MRRNSDPDGVLTADAEMGGYFSQSNVPLADTRAISVRADCNTPRAYRPDACEQPMGPCWLLHPRTSRQPLVRSR